MGISAKRLFKDIDGLAFPDRQRLLAAKARQLAGTPELDALLDDLHGQSSNRRFARLIGVQLAYVARHRAHVERSLAGPESEVSRLVGRLSQDRLFEVAATLTESTTAPAPQLLAIAVADAAGGEAGWPDRWRELVHGLREHADGDVRVAALDTFTRAE